VINSDDTSRGQRVQAGQDWSATYTAKGFEDCGDRFTAFLRRAAHLSHHTGQIIYLCKELERQGRT
jgi:hypothetical protein